MGKGDKRTKRGKLFRGSKGKLSPAKRPAVVVKAEPKPRAPRVPKEPPAPAPAPVEPPAGPEEA